MNPFLPLGFILLSILYINRPLPSFKISNEITALRIELEVPSLRKKRNIDIEIIESINSATGIQLKTDLVEPLYLEKVNKFLNDNDSLLYSKSEKKRTLDIEKKLISIGPNRTLQLIIPFKGNEQ